MTSTSCKAIIFDMDGLLIDSEPIWFEAEAGALADIGVTLTEEMALASRGMRIDEAVDTWHKIRQWSTPSVDEIVEDILIRMKRLIPEKGALQPGAHYILDLAKQIGVKRALASSSPFGIIEVTLQHFNINDFDAVHSAESEKHGKPDPDVYRTTIERLGVPSELCLAFEDSINGAKAAKAAGMKCIAVPAKEERDDTRFGVADKVVESLETVTEEMIQGIFNIHHS